MQFIWFVLYCSNSANEANGEDNPAQKDEPGQPERSTAETKDDTKFVYENISLLTGLASMKFKDDFGN